jgi:putative DNA methylase
MTTSIRKKLIEVSIPLEAINVASAREKSIRHGHPSTLHLWWARRPLAACRAILFAQLVDDPSSWPDRFPTAEAQETERRRLHKVIEAMVPWEASNNETILNAARWEIARSVAWGLGEEPPAQGDGAAILDYLQIKAPPVYDPFSGGGSIPLEAQRLGLRAYGSDLNPVAVLIGKALVEIPPKFAGRSPVNPKSRVEAANGQLRAWRGAQGLAEDVRYYGQWMRDEAEKRIGHLYPKATLADGSQATVIAWLWARTVRSPDPAAKGAMVPLVSSFMLSAKEGKKTWAEPVIDKDDPDGWHFEIDTGSISKATEDKLKLGTKAGKGQAFVCVLTGASIDRGYIQAEGKADRLGQRLMAVVAEGNRTRFYLPPTPAHEEAATLRDDVHVRELRETVFAAPTPTRAMVTGGVCSAYGLRSYADLFTTRQFLALNTLSSLVPDAGARALADCIAAGLSEGGSSLPDGGTGAQAYADAIATYLGLIVGRSTDAWSSITTWASAGEFIRNTFARQALPMTWDFSECNPFSSSSGNFGGSIEWTTKALEQTPANGFGAINQVVAQNNNFPVRPVVISTDPPYYDNIAYSDMSDYFYLWHKLSLGNVWPELYRRITTPKDSELVATAYRHGGREKAEHFFMSEMARAISAMRNAAVEDTPLAIYYAFKQSQADDQGVTSAGWASFLQAVVNAGLTVDGTWPVRTERSSRTISVGTNALASSIVLVCRKRSENAETITRADFVRALKREMPSAIDAIRKAGVGPVDMQPSVLGPGMGVFSRHAKVIEDDDSAMSVKTALTVINRVWEEIENELDQAFDPETQVALAWYATYGFDARASGELITLTTAKNTSDRALFASGVFKDMKGKAGLTAREELPRGWSPASDKTLTTWECVQHTARMLNATDGGGEAAAALVAQMGPKAEEARALAYRLFEIATNKGWAAEALVYNELAQEWTKLEDRAATLDSAGLPPGPNQTTFAFDGSA